MKKIVLLFLYVLSTVVLSAATHIVSSSADDGAGSLRNILANIEADDVVNIPSNYIITLNSPIELGKHVTINGQGATIQTVDPGNSPYRLFVLGSATGSTICNITFNDVVFKGGDVRLNTEGTSPSFGGAILILKRINLNLNGCEISHSKAVRGGAICVIDGQGFSSRIENCKFQGNQASEYGGAFYFNKSQSAENSAGESIVMHTIFEANNSAIASAVKVNVPARFSNCLFKENMAPYLTTSASTAGSGVFLVDDNPNSNIRLESCAFIGNNNGATNPAVKHDGGSAFVANSATTTFFITNCTFYNNQGARGAIYLRLGKMFLVNNTITGNVGYCSSAGMVSGGMTGGTQTSTGIQVTHVNNIFAYNYFYSGTEAGVLRDWSIPSKVYFLGERNLVGEAKYTPSEGTYQCVNPVPFFYDEPEYEDPLFASYTTNHLGLRVPVLDPVTNTVSLDKNGVATGKALSKEIAIDPEIEALIPLTDQRGQIRSTIAPSLGSYEYNLTSSIEGVVVAEKPFIAINPASEYLMLNRVEEINKIVIFDTTGKTVYTLKEPSAVVELTIPQGLYFVRFETKSSIVAEKLIVK